MKHFMSVPTTCIQGGLAFIVERKTEYHNLSMLRGIQVAWEFKILWV